MQWFKISLVFLAGALFIYLLSTSIEPTSKPTIISDLGTDAPDFSLDTVTGTPVKLSQFEGKIVVLNFWASWCPPCRKEIPDLVAAQNQYKSRGVEIIGVAVDGDQPEKIESFAKKHGVNYTIALDDGQIFEAWGGSAIPLTFFIDRKGRIRERFDGLITREELNNILEQMLSES